MFNYKDFMEKKEIKEFWDCSLFKNSFLCLPKGNLYHYTSANALSSIIQNQELWTTKSNFMNDTSEIQYACELFLKRLECSKLREEDKQSIKKCFEEGKSEGIFDSMYVLCLSANPDSLPMWSYYGTNDGYNIGISPQFVNDFANTNFIMNKALITDDKGNAKWVESINSKCVSVDTNGDVSYGSGIKANYVLYDETKQVKIFDLLLEEIGNIILENSHNPSIQINIMLNTLFDFIPFMKDYSYHNEEEYRVLVKLEGTGGNQLMLNKIQKYRVFKGALIPYITLVLNKPNYFNSIMASPFNRSELVLLGMQDVISTYPSQLDLLYSKIPSRF
ncbi:DUF2971 domain-containing protein [Clostridium algoriphilum]|uniref:DUF2971 domain-containing protein n=1 Tax=Clostridium algoriphilum TaxID=198347 RepID=UPI001CF5BE52|nr:DUF2971 domain-containing protein [Clostridium algoriphilum]MCB2296117.1 DUF2971 domain-containing protein [Clostridium algoriphilum]